MAGEIEIAQSPLEVPPLGWRRFTSQMLLGVAITLGMTLLWAAEGVRNRFFRLLDWARIKPKTRRASAFPPGRPRKLKPHS